MHITFTNPQTGEQKTVKQGFSWVLFLLTEFYGIPLFIRGLHLHGAIVALIGAVAVLAPTISALVPLSGLGLIGVMVFYGIKGNELTMAMLERKGWIRSSPGLPQSSAVAAMPIGDANPAVEDGEKTCLRCAETVKAAAVTCKHCGFAFAGAMAAPKSNKLVKAFGIVAAVIVGLIVMGAIASEPKDEKLVESTDPAASDEQAESSDTDSDIARAILAGDGSVCGQPEMAQKVDDFLWGEAALITAYPDVNVSSIRKVVSENRIKLPAATIGGVRPDLGVVVCNFGRMAIQAQATADGEHVRLSPGNSTTATYLLVFRASLDREIKKHRGQSRTPQEAAATEAVDE